ncbi:hypothetical protein OE88DRAFT_1804728 [Heliocybe sulcata]|uniref:Uncharacterized protein n=1 Tax=Heliocybe sulcata TaxID=5364 RepID=A0A5C3NEZ8_9AGAM|nr:hypothetical protein OE88DRAFT_1804728 [Heliocybe sulcata]
MRRLVSVFQKRSDKSESADGSEASAPRTTRKISSRLLNTPSHITVSTGRPSFAAANSSSSSSTGSTSLQTPEDDAGPYASQDAPKKALMSWLARRKTGSSQRLDAPSARDWEAAGPPVPALHQPPLPHLSSDQQNTEDSEDDTSSEESDDEAPPAIDRLIPNVTAAALSSSRNKLLSLISSNLTPPFFPPPCLHPPSGPLFPRSCNLARTLPFEDSTASYMHKTVLLRRLRSNKLSRPEALSIAPFATKIVGQPKSKMRSVSPEAEAAVEAKRVERFSEGLRRWACRPCFEDRMVLWEPAEAASGRSDISWKRVTGNGKGYGVASLEFSEGLEALAGLLEEELPEGPASSEAVSYSIEDVRAPPTALSPSVHVPLDHKSSSKPNLPSLFGSRQGSMPSLAIHVPRPAPLSIPSSPSTAPTSPESPMPSYPRRSPAPTDTKSLAVPTPSKDETADDIADRIPLGYALRLKKQREQKARFLQEEKQRRVLEEKKTIVEERRKHEEEKLQWEKERKAWELEKKAMEEEKKRKKYKDEVVAARMRREEERSGARRVPVVESDREESRTRRETSRSRPNRQMSDPHLPAPPVSRPASVAETHHRPLSMYSATRGASTEDVRLKDRGRKPSRRQSSGSDAQGSSMPVAPPSTWSMYGMPAVPPVPVMAMPPYVASPYADSMPLLPPNAPFMSQGYGDRNRSRSRSGSKSRRDGSPSSGSSSRSRPQSYRSNSSSEHVHHVQGTSNSSSHRGHERRPSGGESPSRLSVPRSTLGTQGRSYSGSDVERRYSSVRGQSSSSPSTSSRPTIVSSASWGGPWVAQPTMAPMPMYGGSPGFAVHPMPMMAPGVHQARASPTSQRQSVIF